MRHAIHDIRISSGQWPRCDVTYGTMRLARFPRSYEKAGTKTYTCQKRNLWWFSILKCTRNTIHSTNFLQPSPTSMGHIWNVLKIISYLCKKSLQISKTADRQPQVTCLCTVSQRNALWTPYSPLTHPKTTDTSRHMILTFPMDTFITVLCVFVCLMTSYIAVTIFTESGLKTMSL
jgi:hypothetical protein